MNMKSGWKEEQREHEMGLTGWRERVGFRTEGASLVEWRPCCGDLEK